MSWIISLVVVAACAVLNRLRGDERWKPSWLPGRALFYVAPAIGTVALLAQPWPVALAFAAGYAFWAVWGWGHVQMRGRGLGFRVLRHHRLHLPLPPAPFIGLAACGGRHWRLLGRPHHRSMTMRLAA